MCSCLHVHGCQNQCVFFRGSSRLPFRHSTDSLPSWSCGFNLQLVQLVGGFGSSSLVTLPWVSTVVLSPTLYVGHPLGFAPEAALETLGLSLWWPGVEVVQLFGSQWFWQHQVLRGVGGWGSRKYSALEGCGNQYWPTRSSILAWRTTLPDREAWQASLQGPKDSDMTEATLHA